MKKNFRIGRHLIPLWLVVAVLLSGIASGVVAGYIWETITLDLEVEEPLEIISYPDELDLFPGETKEFNITIENLASVDYIVLLDFLLDNATYQDNYVTFGEIYTVIPGQQDLTAWLRVESDAPPIKTSLTIYLERVAQPPPPPEEEELRVIWHAWSGTTYIDLSVRNTGTVGLIMENIHVNGAAPTGYDFDVGTAGNQTSQSVAVDASYTVRIWYSFISGAQYEFVIGTAMGTRCTYISRAP